MTWLYALLHHVLFVGHAVLAGYVFGGTLWLVWLGVRGLAARGDEPAVAVAADPIAATLRDWLPFVLGAAITFGVGPLLFVQLREGGAFYTANLLLSHRLLLILPALTLGFYLLYVQKTAWAWVRAPWGRLAVPLMALLCFGFTAWSWSENHLLAADRARWSEVYAAGPGFVWSPALPSRLLVFAGLALQGAAVLLAVQRPALRLEPAQRTRLTAAAGVGAALLASGCLLHPPVPGADGVAFGAVAIVAAQLVLVASTWRPGPVWRVAGPIALVVAAERLAAVREAVRAAAAGEADYAANQSRQGLLVFGLAAVLTAAAIVWCVRRVRRDLRAPTP